jgi:ankyrin repeat protein
MQLEAEDANGRTPLHYACYYSSSEVVSELCHWCADVNHVDVKGRTPLHVVVCRKHQGVPPFPSRHPRNIGEVVYGCT